MADNLLGVGLYTPREAALYARVSSTQKLVRWIHGSRVGDSVVNAQLSDDESRTITFLDFIQALSIKTIRAQFPKVSLQKLRQAVEHASSKYGLLYPFAMPHTTFILDSDVVIKRPGDELDEDEYVEITGKHRDQIIIHKVFEPYLKDVTFATDGSKLAIMYTALRSRDGKIDVIMDPQRQFGQPILPSGYTAATLFDAYVSEGGIDAAAEMYEVNSDEVALAVEYHDSLPISNSKAA